jgi:L-lactate dehydrogenase complex protein LldE
MTAPKRQRVGLLVTCLVDLFRPSVGFAAVRLLENAGFEVLVPEQGCCGQPNFNSGDRSGAREIAVRALHSFDACDYVVAPSGSCAAMVRRHYPELFPAGSTEADAARAMAEKTWELSSFLYDVAGVTEVTARLPASAVYHDACSGLRELGIRRQPRALLQTVADLELREMSQPEVCCGFGGLFCMKYPHVSDAIVGRKCRDIADTGADYLVAGDLGCLLHLEGKLHREGSAVQALHVAEVLAGLTDDEGSESDGN